MRFKYSTLDSSQNEFDALPRVTLTLRLNSQAIEVTGLVDSGATVNVLPYQMGMQLGASWNPSKATIQLAGNLAKLKAMPLFVMGQVGNFAPVNLAFAWVQSDNIPLILGQTNFFMEFEVCFYRSQFEFEVKPKVS